MINGRLFKIILQRLHECPLRTLVLMGWWSPLSFLIWSCVLTSSTGYFYICVLAERRKRRGGEHTSTFSKLVCPVGPGAGSGVRSLHQHHQERHQRSPNVQKSHYQWVPHFLSTLYYWKWTCEIVFKMTQFLPGWSGATLFSCCVCQIFKKKKKKKSMPRNSIMKSDKSLLAPHSSIQQKSNNSLLRDHMLLHTLPCWIASSCFCSRTNRFYRAWKSR